MYGLRSKRHARETRVVRGGWVSIYQLVFAGPHPRETHGAPPPWLPALASLAPVTSSNLPLGEGDSVKYRLSHAPCRHHRRRLWRALRGPGAEAGAGRVTLSTAATITSFSRCCIRWRRRRCRRATSPRRSAGSCGARRTSRCCSPRWSDSTRRAKRLSLTDGVLAYDYLIVAAGATHAYFGHDEWRSPAPGAQDASRTRSRFGGACCSPSSGPSARRIRRGVPPLTFVVVGGGPTGVEMAGALAEISRHSLARDFRHFDPDRRGSS